MPYGEAKIYHDGSHFIAIPYVPNPRSRRPKPPEEQITVVDENADNETIDGLSETDETTNDTSKKREAAKHTPLCRFPLTSPTSIKYFNPHQRHPNLQRHQQYTEKRTFFQHVPDNSAQLLDNTFEKGYTKLRKDIETYPIIK